MRERHRHRQFEHEQRPQPRVDVILAHCRPLEHDWVKQAMRTVELQTYPHLGLWTIDNSDHALTLGEAWNAGVQRSEAELVAFIHEEDAYTADMIEALVTFLGMAQQNDANVVHCTSFVTLLDERSGKTVPLNMPQVGMWQRSALQAHPFPAKDQRPEAGALHAMREAMEPKQSVTVAVAHHYGYIFRNHNFRPDRVDIR